MKRLKRLTSILLVLGIVLGLMPLSAFAAEPENTAETTFTVTKPDNDGEDTYTFTLDDDGTVKLTAFDTTATEADAEIPSTDYSEVSIGIGAFAHCEKLKTVILPDSIISIGTGAFGGCYKLRTVNLGNSVRSIDMNAFVLCTSLESVTIPSSVQTIGENAFHFGLGGENKQLVELHYTGTQEQWDGLAKKYDFENINPMLYKPQNFYCAHTVSFDCGGKAEGTSKEVLYEGIVTPPDAPTAEGYRFEGWYTQENGGVPFDFSQPITEDVTVYAHWSEVKPDHTVYFDCGSQAKGFSVVVQYEKPVKKPTDPEAKGYQFDGWYTQENGGVPFDFNQEITKDVTVYAHWSVKPTPTPDPKPNPKPNPDPDPNPNPNPDPEPNPNPNPNPDAKEYTLTEKDGTLVRVTVEKNGTTVDITEKVVLEKDGATQIGKIPAGAMVTVAANAAPEGMVFAQWNISDPELMGDPDVAHTSQTMTFPMPPADVTVEAMYESAENARETELLGGAALIGAVGISAVVLAYQAHQLGTELYLKYLLPSGAALPQNRIQLAELLWRNAGEPVPDVNAMYEDIGLNEETAQQAAQWAVENELMELPDEEHTEQFKPDEQISYGEAIRAWKKAQQLKTAE